MHKLILISFLTSSLASCGQAYSAPMDLKEELMEMCDRINVLEFHLMEGTPLTDCEARFEQSPTEEKEEVKDAIH